MRIENEFTTETRSLGETQNNKVLKMHFLGLRISGMIRFH
jgi:hypothetical protein